MEGDLSEKIFRNLDNFRCFTSDGTLVVLDVASLEPFLVVRRVRLVLLGMVASLVLLGIQLVVPGTDVVPLVAFLVDRPSSDADPLVALVAYPLWYVARHLASD